MLIGTYELTSIGMLVDEMPMLARAINNPSNSLNWCQRKAV